MAPADRRAIARTRPSNALLKRPTSLPAAHLTCVGASRARNRRHCARLLGRGRPAHRGAARRHAGVGRALRAASGRLSIDAELIAGIQADRAVRDQRVLLIPKAIRIRHRWTTTSIFWRRKVDAGATRAIRQFCFDTEAMRTVSRSGGSARAEHSHCPRADADDEFQGRRAHGGTQRRQRSGVAAALYEGLDDDARQPQGDRRSPTRRAGPGACATTASITSTSTRSTRPI